MKCKHKYTHCKNILVLKFNSRANLVYAIMRKRRVDEYYKVTDDYMLFALLAKTTVPLGVLKL